MFKSNDILRKQTALKVFLKCFYLCINLFLQLSTVFVVFSLVRFCLLRIWYDWWLQGERKISVLVGISIAFSVHVIGVYWWYQNDDLLYPLVMLPPKVIPPFWHAVFIIMVNGNLFVPSFYCSCSFQMLNFEFVCFK